MKMKVRKIVMSDFEHQLEITNFKNKKDMDDSYQYMVAQLDIHFCEKSKSDRSLTKRDVEHIKRILNDDDYNLEEAYKEVIYFLSDYKCLMPYKTRQRYFYNRLNKDACIYLMKAIDRIVELTSEDYCDVCAELGMCNSELLDFLDAYRCDHGWIENKY